MGIARVGAVAVALLALPTTAAASDQCVNPGGTGGCHASLQAAVDAASDGDTVRIANGRYIEAIDIPSSKRLNLVGSGGFNCFGPDGNCGPERQTFIEADNNETTATIDMPGGGTLRSLQVGHRRTPASDPNSVDSIRFVNTTGDASLTLDDVEVFSPEEWKGGGGNAVRVENGGNPANHTSLVVRSSFFWSSPGAGIRFTAAGGSLKMSQTASRGSYYVGDGTPGLLLQGGGSATIEGGQLAGGNGIVVDGGSLWVNGTKIQGEHDALSLLTESGQPSRATISNAYLEGETHTSAPTRSAVRGIARGAPVDFSARGSTLVARDPTTGGVVMDASPGQRADATLLSTIVRNEGAPSGVLELSARGEGRIAADYSSFSTSSRGAPAPGAGTNLAGDPQFLNDPMQARFVLSASSPLIDRGAPALARPGAIDIQGSPRSLDGDGDCVAVPDIGAYERAALPCGRPRLERVTMTNRVFAPMGRSRRRARASAKSRRRIRHGTRFVYTLSERARVTIVIERCSKVRKRTRCGRHRRATVLRNRKGRGRRSTRFSGRVKGRALRPGRYRARIRARDMQGLRSAERRLAFRVVR